MMSSYNRTSDSTATTRSRNNEMVVAKEDADDDENDNSKNISKDISLSSSSVDASASTSNMERKVEPQQEEEEELPPCMSLYPTIMGTNTYSTTAPTSGLTPSTSTSSSSIPGDDNDDECCEDIEQLEEEEGDNTDPITVSAAAAATTIERKLSNEEARSPSPKMRTMKNNKESNEESSGDDDDNESDDDDDKTAAIYDVDDSDSDSDEGDDKTSIATNAATVAVNANVNDTDDNKAANATPTFPSSSSSTVVANTCNTSRSSNTAAAAAVVTRNRKRKSVVEEEEESTPANSNTSKRSNKSNNNRQSSASDPILLLSSSSEDEEEDAEEEEDDDDDVNEDEDDPEKATVVTPEEQHRKHDRNDDDSKHKTDDGVDDDEDKGKESKNNNNSNNNNNNNHNNNNKIDHDNSSSSSDSDSDDFLRDHHRRRQSRSRKNYWLSSSSRDSKLLHLEKMNNRNKENDSTDTNNSINNDADTALQLLLWDIGFNYEIYPHQFEAIRFVAGFISTFPFRHPNNNNNNDNNINKNNNNKTMTTNEKIMLNLDGNGESIRLDSLRLAAAAAAAAAAIGTNNNSNNNCSSNTNTNTNTNTHSNSNSNSNSNSKNTNTSGNEYVLPTRGMLLGDEMGLGKTIEALAGAALRNSMQLMASPSSVAPSASSAQQRHRNRQKLLPTLIISPQDGIQNQWYETLIKSGIEPARIEVIGERKNSSKKRTTTTSMSSRGQQLQRLKQEQEGGCFILCTRYKVQSEMKMLFDNCITNTGGKGVANNNHRNSNNGHSNKKQPPQWQQTRMKKKSSSSLLFPNVPLQHIGKLRNQYVSDKGKGKEKNNFIRDKESSQDCVARLIAGMNSIKAYQTVIVDEAHFCKNTLAYWGLGLALLGSTSHRTALLTGTPYNNGPSDMAALMIYIDPRHIASSTKWWEKATSATSNKKIVEAVSDWRNAFMIRRTKDILEDKLPQRNRTIRSVEAHPSELWIYINYEAKFLNALKSFDRMKDSSNRRRKNKAFEVMMAVLSCSRMSLIHPMLPRGRELTIQFSPSRRHLLKREERPKVCVYCDSDPSRKKDSDSHSDSHSGSDSDSNSHSGSDSDSDSDSSRRVRTDIMNLHVDGLDDEDDLEVAKSSNEDKKKGPILPLGPDICQVSESDCRHFAHKRCLAIHYEEGGTACPRCNGLTSRIHDNLHGNEYCKEISTSLSQNGFTGSAKIEEAIKWFKTTVPDDDKAIILSFFKGSLDLIEGILVEDLGIGCARYDGDIDKDSREADLKRFKTEDTCRVLLASVQSGGTGLNITEANHVLFLDRWFNPCVHDQAESRVHRLGQKKEVNIAYLDIDLTIDVVMKEINEIKGGNANILLADGSSLGIAATTVGYRDISGVIGKKMKEIRLMREKLITNNTNEPKKSKTKIEKEDDIPKRAPGIGSFKKSSNVKKESKDGMPKRVPGAGSFKKTSNTKKKNKGDIPGITTDEIIELSSDEEGDNNVIDIQKARRISLDGITIELSSDEEDDSDDADLQKARRVSLVDPRSDLSMKKG